MHFQRNISDLKSEDAKNTFSSVLELRSSSVLRDTIILVDPKETDSGKICVGMTVIYPKCTTSGHSHEDMEEVYYIISGNGTMIIGEDTFSIKAGDVFYIPFGGIFHKTINTDNMPMKYLWITNKR